MKITVIGTGYVGLVTGACLAEMGNHVVCLDRDSERIAALQNGHLPIHEPGLLDIVLRNAHGGRLAFTGDVDRAVAHGQVQFIAVGTPAGEDGAADLQHVLAAAQAIAERMQDAKLIVNKSTVPVGTADRVREVVAQVLQARAKLSPRCCRRAACRGWTPAWPPIPSSSRRVRRCRTSCAPTA